MSVTSTPRPVTPLARVPTRALVVAGGIFAVAVALAAIDTEPTPVVAPVRPVAATPAPGEFRLGPGHQDPPGIVNPVPRPLAEPAPGEFRLGPGHQDPPGIVNPVR